MRQRTPDCYILYASRQQPGRLSPILSLLLFLAGAGGGIILSLAYHLRGIPLSKWLVVAHAMLTVLALVLLYLAAFKDA